MNWLAVLLSAAALGGTAAPGEVKPTTKHECVAKAKQAKKPKKCKKAPKAKTKPRQTPSSSKPDSGSSTPAPATGQSPGAEPEATATPAPNQPAATPTPTPTPGPVYPTRTGVDLVELPEWAIKPSYRTLAAGRIDFNVNNLGEDDHNLSIRRSGTEYGRLDLAPGDSGTLTLTLNPGSYVLYCSLLGHEDAGMRSSVSVR